MAETDVAGVGSAAETTEDVNSTSPNAPNSTSLLTNNGSSRQPSTTNSSVNGANNGLTSEQRRKLIAEAEQQRTEQRRVQLIESQKRAEALREKQREERKRRIEETRLREEARQKRAQETKKEIERHYKDHMQTILQRNRDRTLNNAEQLRQAPNIMRASHFSSKPTTTVSSANGDRMATSFTVAFGSSAPRSICTKASEAALRSQAAFEARLASYLKGRHSGCFLTQSSLYTTYALYVKPDLLPEDHPIRRHHQQLMLENQHSLLGSPRRAVSANPTLRIAKKFTASAGVETDRSQTATRQQSQEHRSRPLERQVAGQAGLPPLRRAASSQHFAEPTIAYSNKVRGAPPPEIALSATRRRNASGSRDVLPKLRSVPGRSTVPRGRCNSYAAPTTASTNRQRAPSHDLKPTSGEDRTDLSRRKPSVPTNAVTNQSGGVSEDREPLAPKTSQTNASSLKPKRVKSLKPVSTVKPSPVSSKTETDQAKPHESFSSNPPPSPPHASLAPAKDLVLSLDPTNLATELEHPDEKSSSPSQPPCESSTAEFGLSAPSQPEVETSTPVEEFERTPPIASLEVPESKEQKIAVENITKEEEERVDEPRTPSAVTEEAPNAVIENEKEIEGEKVAAQETTEETEISGDTITGERSEALPDAASTEGCEVEEERSQKLAAQIPSGPIKASTTGSGEGGCLPEEEAAIYRAKMAEQRRLAKERLAEQERREAEEERERKERREAERQAAIQAARERAVEEARLAAEARLAREAAEQEARLQAEREAQERSTKERQRLEAIERERLENFRKAEEERALRKKRLDSIMSRVNRSDRSLSRGITSSESSNSLSGVAATTTSGGVVDVGGVGSAALTGAEAKPAVHFSLGPGSAEQSNVFQRETPDSSITPNHNGFSHGLSKTTGTHFNSPLLQNLFSGGSSRLAGALAAQSSSSPSASSALPDDAVPSESRLAME